MTQLIWEQATLKSSFRRITQDAMLSVRIADKSAFFIVADGMGGAVAGAEAATISVEIVGNYLRQMLLNPSSSAIPICDLLVTGIQMANTEIVARNLEGAASVTAVYVADTDVTIAHVGVNRVFLVTQSNIKKLVRIHDLLTEWLKQGTISRKVIESHPVDSKPTRMVGYEGKLEVDCSSMQLSSGDYLVLCTVGCLASWDDSVNEPEIKRIVLAAASLDQCCAQLIQFGVGKNGDHTDATVIVIHLID